VLQVNELSCQIIDEGFTKSRSLGTFYSTKMENLKETYNDILPHGRLFYSLKDMDVFSERHEEICAELTRRLHKGTHNNGNLEMESSTPVYSNEFSNVFHRRDCSKLDDSEGLIKFDTSQKASRDGGLPCNYCKP